MEFKFKYVNEEQFMKVIKKVQRERKYKQDAVHVLPLSTKERFVNVPVEEYPEREVEPCKDSQCLEERVSKECSSPENSHSLSVSQGYEVKERHRGTVYSLTLRLHNVRRDILTSLDELILHNERINQKHSYFKNSNEDMGESMKDAKARNCLCLIVKQEYPFVITIRRLSLIAIRQDAVFHLKVLLDCHNIALKMLKIFIRGSPYVLMLDKSKDKLNSLLERIIALSTVCKLFSIENNDMVSSKDFLMDDVDRKCLSLLVSGKERMSMIPKGYKDKNVKGSENICSHCGINTMTSDGVQDDEIRIPIKKFKKLANRVFGCKEKSAETRKKRKSHYKERGLISIRNSKEKVNTLKEEKTAANTGASDSLSTLEHPVPDANRPPLCSDTSLRVIIPGSESNCEVAKEENSNLILDVIEDERPKSKETFEPFEGIQNNLPGITENSHDNQQVKHDELQQSVVHSDGVGPNKQLVSSQTMNEEQQQGISSVKDDLKIPDDIIKMSNAAGSISNKVIGDCLSRVSCEVDNFVEDFIQRMFSLEFT